MKTLLQYINEARATIGELPFEYELFEKFIQDAIIDAKYDDSEYWGAMKTKVTGYHKDIWKWFYSWCESYLYMKDIPLLNFYNAMKQIPLDRFNRVLGAGSNGIVLDMDGDKVIKIFYGDTIKLIDKPFIEYCYKHNSKVFPKVYKIGKNWCIMEKLNVRTTKCHMYMDIMDNVYINNRSVIMYVCDNNKLPLFNKLSKNEKEVANWCFAVKKEMENINSKYIKYPGDLVLNNIGERDNGEIVFFDV